MTPREIFLKGCNEIAQHFPDFTPKQKGQTLTKVSENKDLVFEIHFQSSMRNVGSTAKIIPLVKIYSKAMKKANLPYSAGCIFDNSLGYLSSNEYKTWLLGGASFDDTVKDIVERIEKYVLPIFEQFEDREKLIDFLVENTAKFNKFVNPNDFLLFYYMYFYAGKEKAQIYLNKIIQNDKLKNKYIGLYKNLLQTPKENIDPDESEFMNAETIRFAYLNDIQIDINQ
ncbi:MAG: hypothetical protein Q4C98_05590 [Capnocytophaga sp.]|nr:hypothetical protein [Capnocytophaga sp.]